MYYFSIFIKIYVKFKDRIFNISNYLNENKTLCYFYYISPYFPSV